MRRLLPGPAATVSVAEAYGVPRSRVATSRGSRPWVGMCMVSSIDGSTVVDGASLALSGPADRDVLLGLRRLADAILVGSGTVRAEGYGPPSKVGQRVGVVSSRGDIDLDAPLFAAGAGFLVVPEDAALPVDAPVAQIRAGRGTVDLALALESIGGDFLQLEGGARLNAAMLAADLVDEIDLTVSPRAVGGDGPRLTTGAPDLALGFDLAHVCEDDGFLFLRYLRRR
jgi:riboflavin biosynthesis pyrimidine reductase